MNAAWPAVLLLAASLIACSDTNDPTTTDTDADQAAVPAVTELGPYAVGYRSWPHTYTPPVGDDRDIEIHAWYPTLATEGETGRYGIYADATDTLLDAPPAPVDDPRRPFPSGRPLLLYSHGDQGYGADAARLHRHFAAHGWVVLAADHTDNLLFANLTPTPPLHWLHRPSDLTALADALDQLPASDPLSGLAHTDRFVVSGHSRGGTTVWSLLGARLDPEDPDRWCAGCEPGEVAAAMEANLSESRAVAGIVMGASVRGDLFGPDPLEGVASPVLFMTGTEDGDGGANAWTEVSNLDALWVQLEGGCHLSFNLGVCPTLDPEEGFEAILAHALGFAAHHLLQQAETEPWARGEVRATEAVRTTYTGP